MAFDPTKGLLYIPAMLNSAEISLEDQPSQTQSRYALTSAAKVTRAPGAAPDSSRLIAWDPVKQKFIWNVDRPTPVASGVLATAGSLVFQGTTDGQLEALDGASGGRVWSIEVGTSITAAPITYEVNGTQMLAVVAGAGGASLLAGGQAAAQHVPRNNTPRLLAFSLTGSAKLPTAPPHETAAPLPARADSAAAESGRGKLLYAQYCARCHGEDTLNAGPLKDLKRSDHLADASRWQRVVFAGLLTQTGMPGFMAELKPEDVEAIRAYVVDRAIANRTPSH
jgi:mono/diheme cytochrome c family protein